nr:ATP-grasp domain-containing protein [uncultured Methylotenera sp.]
MVAIDAFSDAQTTALAEKALVVKYDEVGFDAEDLLQTLHALDNENLDNENLGSEGLQLSRFAGFVYGSGFEAQPDLLQKVAALIPVIGNSPATLAATKDLNVFFTAMQRLNIKHPETLAQLPAEVDLSLYIRKLSGGSGGVHIQPAALMHGHALEHHYFQRKLAGVPVSLLFIANGKDVEIVGFNEQWVSASAQLPYRYGGAVSHTALSVTLQQQLLEAARQLTIEFDLLGLNSLDAIVHRDYSDNSADAGSAQVYVLEINPRLSATVDLYDNNGVLFERHMQACMHRRLVDDGEVQAKYETASKAHAIVYAEVDITLEAEMVWPSWVTDTPGLLNSPLKIVAGAPVCSVLAYANNADAAKKEVLARVQQIKNLLQSTH